MKLKLNKDLISSLSSEFEISDRYLFYLLTNQESKAREKSSAEIRELIPQDLLKYRYLLHPIRLTIMKLIYHEEILPSAKIKQVLDVSWGDFATHTKSLKEKGYIKVKDTFNEKGSKIQVVYILEIGRKEYKELLDLLSKFVETNSSYESILYDDLQLKKDKDLYPKR